MKALIFSVLIVLLLASCAPKPNPNLQIRQAVAATLLAVPTSTPYPQPTLFPSPTPVNLIGLFCEYQFCIGHPADMAFYDVNAANNQISPSTYQSGLLAAYSANLFIELMWQFAPGTTDPQFLLDLILEEIDTRGNMDIRLIGDFNVFYTLLTNTTPLVPYGAAAAWVCGERVFAWKVYTPNTNSPAALFDVAISRFTCN